MNTRAKREIRNKARLIYCLVDILEYDIENLKHDADECDPSVLTDTLLGAKETLQNITDLIAEMEYTIYLETFKET